MNVWSGTPHCGFQKFEDNRRVVSISFFFSFFVSSGVVFGGLELGKEMESASAGRDSDRWASFVNTT